MCDYDFGNLTDASGVTPRINHLRDDASLLTLTIALTSTRLTLILTLTPTADHRTCGCYKNVLRTRFEISPPDVTTLLMGVEA